MSRVLEGICTSREYPASALREKVYGARGLAAFRSVKQQMMDVCQAVFSRPETLAEGHQ